MIYKVENIKTEKYTDELFQNAYSTMSNDRKQKADRYRFDSDRRLCVFSDYLLRSMLKSCSVENPEFYIDPKGKPALKGNHLYFNVSHSHDFIACVVDKAPVGIDIEVIRKVSLTLINKVCTEEELGFVLGKDNTFSEDTDTCIRFFRVWTAKEAFLKYTGEGLSGGLKNICVADKNGLKTKLSDNIYLINEYTEQYSLAVVSENPPENI